MDNFLDIHRFVHGEPVNVNKKGQLQTSSKMSWVGFGLTLISHRLLSRA